MQCGLALSELHSELFIALAQISWQNSRLRSIANVTMTPRGGETFRAAKEMAKAAGIHHVTSTIFRLPPPTPPARLVHDENYSYQFEFPDKNRKLCLRLSPFIKRCE